MLSVCVAFLLVTCSLAAPTEDGAVSSHENADRSLLGGCHSTFNPTTNPCQNNAMGQVNYAHPSDNTKFLQCGMYGRLFVVQCPSGEVYDVATSTCVQQKVLISQPTNILQTGIQNPCTNQNINSGRIYFALSNDNTRFIACDQSGNAQLVTCPSNMVWDQNRFACTFHVVQGVALHPGLLGTGVTSLTGAISTSNPCDAQAMNANALFFPHPDPSKFIQCDLEGNAFVQQCPSGLCWNQSLETCANNAGFQLTGNGSIRPGGIIQVTG